jgi:hypothetical protein
MACFNRWFKDVERYALKRAKRLLPCTPTAFSETESEHFEDSPNDPEQGASLP